MDIVSNMLKYGYEMKLDAFRHLYISPLEKCNLRCKICYTKKSGHVLSNKTILDFVNRYQKEIGLKTITFCGGEVFLLKDFSSLINHLTNQGIFVQIITNGTIDKLSKFNNPNSINMIVSLDGNEPYHDKNRGKGMFKKSFYFLKKAQALKFHTEVFSIITKENLKDIDNFENLVKVPVTYHPRKPLAYLKNHPISNKIGETIGFSFISDNERIELSKSRKIFPPINFNCFQISLLSNGQVYGCCEGIKPIGNIKDRPKKLIERLVKRLDENGCPETNFHCGY